MAVFSKMAAAAGIGENVLEIAPVKQKIGVDQMKLLATGAPLPMLCWAVKKEMDKALAGKIAKAMTDKGPLRMRFLSACKTLLGRLIMTVSA